MGYETLNLKSRELKLWELWERFKWVTLEGIKTNTSRNLFAPPEIPSSVAVCFLLECSRRFCSDSTHLSRSSAIFTTFEERLYWTRSAREVLPPWESKSWEPTASLHVDEVTMKKACESRLWELTVRQGLLSSQPTVIEITTADHNWLRCYCAWIKSSQYAILCSIS